MMRSTFCCVAIDAGGLNGPRALAPDSSVPVMNAAAAQADPGAANSNGSSDVAAAAELAAGAATSMAVLSLSDKANLKGVPS